MHLWVSKLAYPVTALGPGERLALWVSGCGLRCRGCITPNLRDRHAGVRKTTGAVAERLLAVSRRLDGLTITGGEPFEQARALAELLRQIRAARPHWSVLVYSGHTLASLRRRGAEAEALLGQIDVLIDGPYRSDRPARHPLAGSGNQAVHLLTERGRGMLKHIKALPMGQANLGFGTLDDEDWLIGVMDPATRGAINTRLSTGSS